MSIQNSSKEPSALEPNKSDSQKCSAVEIRGSVFCDDHVDVYLGSESRVRKKILSADYAKEKSFPFETMAKCCDYLYFVCWSNANGNNGFMAELVGSSTIVTGDPAWEVLATNNNSFSGRPAAAVVSAEMALGASNWISPINGQFNNAIGQPYPWTVNGISSNARFVWHDSLSDVGLAYPNSPYIPFAGHDHNEFLIFRIPVQTIHEKTCKQCSCDEKCCGSCSNEKNFHNAILQGGAFDKFFIEKGGVNDPSSCQLPYSDESICRTADLSPVRPCFHLHWGDGASDQIETHDTETAFITICNPFDNITMKGITVVLETAYDLGTSSNGEPKFQIVPDRMIIFDCLEPCTCQSRQIAIITRDVVPGNHRLNLVYCIDSIHVRGQESGDNYFEVNVVMS